MDWTHFLRKSKLQRITHPKSRTEFSVPSWLYATTSMRGAVFTTDNEQFFIFRDGNPVQASNVRKVLRDCLMQLNLDAQLYNTHSLRAGRCVDLRKQNFDLDLLKTLGRWRSNAVFRYLRN